jgi:DNA repair protein RecN (Recombination protein N)
VSKAGATEAVAIAPEAGRIGRLLELTVTDLALIDRLRLELGPGLNVLTGETGAGKSLLIDALGLALGTRADTTLVRHGTDVARVEALFDRLPEPLIAVREVASSGRSTARLDDQAVTAARLAETTGPLVEIHGQHEQQRLLDERWQRDLLDAFGGHEEPRAAMADAVERWRSNRAALAELSLDPRELARRLELLEHEAAEIGGARLRPGEADEIRTRLAAAQHGETIARGSATLAEALTGEGGGARDVTAVALREARALARVDPRFEPIAERLSGLEAELADVADEVRGLADAVEHDPAALARLEERLSVIYGLERRYGDDENAVIAHGEQASAEAERLRGLDGERARRQADDAALLAEVAAAAAVLSARRQDAADEIAGAVGALLVDLGFPAGVFEVALGRRPAGSDEPAVELGGDAVAFDASGIDQVVYRLAPNPGEPPRPLARIASGGELSRVALAIKEVLATADETPTLVFDEVDTGIGGRSADPVGRSLWALARRHQVLCVTHLPQIAAYADAHFQIAKRERDGRTVTEVRALDHEARIVELAQMLGGSGGTATLASARELLDRAEGWRGELLASG